MSLRSKLVYLVIFFLNIFFITRASYCENIRIRHKLHWCVYIVYIYFLIVIKNLIILKKIKVGSNSPSYKIINKFGNKNISLYFTDICNVGECWQGSVDWRAKCILVGAIHNLQTNQYWMHNCTYLNCVFYISQLADFSFFLNIYFSMW